MKRILTILMALILVFVPLGTMPVHAASQTTGADAPANVSYIVVYDCNGGTSGNFGSTIITAYVGAAGNYKMETLLTATRPGYAFDGWYTRPNGGTRVDTDYVFTENTYIYAQWTADPATSPTPDGTRYIITLYPNGGSVQFTNLATDTNGYLAIYNYSQFNPTRSEHTFNGWYTSPTGGTKVNMADKLTADTTVYAQWTAAPKAYQITYDVISGSMQSSADQRLTGTDGRLKSLPTPTRDGYTFNGWYTSRSGGERVDTNYVFTADTTIYAQWAGTVYTITFDPSGGSLTTAAQTTTLDNGKLASLPTPTRSGYKFDGWYTSQTGGTIISTSYVFNANTTVYAQWTAKTYMISIVQGEPLYSTTTILETGTDGKLTSFPALIDEAALLEKGYTFRGWRMNDGTYVDENYIFTADSYVHADWVPASFSMEITLDPMGGTLFDSWNGTLSTGLLKETTLPNGKIETLPTPTRSGYAFSGWYTSSTGGIRVDANYVFPTNATIYARWTAAPGTTTYMIVFNTNNDDGFPSVFSDGRDYLYPRALVTNTNGKLESLPLLPDRSGYYFNGWYTSRTGGARIDTNYSFRADATVYAQWTAISTTPPVPGNTQYAITFNSGDGSPTTTQTTGADGKLASLPTPTRSGYTFDGWHMIQGGAMIDTNYVFTENTTVVALWTAISTPPPVPVKPQYTITFNPNGGSVSATTRQTSTDGKVTSLPTPSRSGYTFNGWYTSQSSGTRISTSYVFNSNATVYAQWTELPEYNIIFDSNGGSPSTYRGWLTNTDGKLSSMPTPTRVGYALNGWYTSRTGGTKITYSHVFTKNTTVYAQWTRATYTVTFDGNVNKGRGETVYILIGSTRTTNSNGKLSSLPTAVRGYTYNNTRYTFDGWYTGMTGGTKISKDSVFTANTTVYAHWIPK